MRIPLAVAPELNTRTACVILIARAISELAPFEPELAFCVIVGQQGRHSIGRDVHEKIDSIAMAHIGLGGGSCPGAALRAQRSRRDDGPLASQLAPISR